MSFLGMCSYCRQFIPNYAALEAPLSSMIHGKGLTPSSAVQWTTEAEQAFTALILLEQKTSHFSTARWLRYNTVLLEMSNITVKRNTVMNSTESHSASYSWIQASHCKKVPDPFEDPSLSVHQHQGEDTQENQTSD